MRTELGSLFLAIACCSFAGSVSAKSEKSNDHVNKLSVASAEVSPRLISPNNDGRLDEAAFTFQVEVRGTDGSAGKGKAKNFLEGEILLQGIGLSESFRFEVPVPKASSGSDWVPITIEQVWSDPLPEGFYDVTYVIRKVHFPDSGKGKTKDEVRGSLGVLQVDVTAPQIQITSPQTGWITRELPISVLGQVFDSANSVSVNVEGVPALIHGEEFSLELMLSEGNHSLIAVAEDSAGNRTDSEPVNITVDLTPPAVSILCPQSGIVTSSESTSLVGDVSDAFGVSSVSVNGQTASVIGNTFYVDNIQLQNGDNLISAIATDFAGNVSTPQLHTVKRVPGGGELISTFVGNGSTVLNGDGLLGPDTSLNLPRGLALNLDGLLFISDSLHRRVRKVDSNGIVSTFAGTGEPGSTGDGGQASLATFFTVQDVDFGPDGSLYILDATVRKVRKVSPNGIVMTVAGSGGFGNAGDGGPATAARLNQPNHAIQDTAGNVLIVDTQNHRIRRVKPNGIIDTAAGNGVRGFSGDGASPQLAQLDSPERIVPGFGGDFYISDTMNQRVRRVGGVASPKLQCTP